MRTMGGRAAAPTATRSPWPMLGATHACANPLTARYGTTHGAAIALMLPHVVRWNSSVTRDRYHELMRCSSSDPRMSLARRLERLAEAGGLPRTLKDVGVTKKDIPGLAEEAAKQWTGTFNPRPWSVAGALEVYKCAY